VALSLVLSTALTVPISLEFFFRKIRWIGGAIGFVTSAQTGASLKKGPPLHPSVKQSWLATV